MRSATESKWRVIGPPEQIEKYDNLTRYSRYVCLGCRASHSTEKSEVGGRVRALKSIVGWVGG